MVPTRLWILLSCALLSACADRIVISPQIPAELLTPVPETEIAPTTTRELALAFAEQTGALRAANGKIESVASIVTKARECADGGCPR